MHSEKSIKEFAFNSILMTVKFEGATKNIGQLGWHKLLNWSHASHLAQFYNLLPHYGTGLSSCCAYNVYGDHCQHTDAPNTPTHCTMALFLCTPSISHSLSLMDTRIIHLGLYNCLGSLKNHLEIKDKVLQNKFFHIQQSQEEKKKKRENYFLLPPIFLLVGSKKVANQN